jgi:hypothetical protein
MTRVDIYVNGAAAGQAQLQGDGSYKLTITQPTTGSTLEDRGTRVGGGLSIFILPYTITAPAAPSNVRIIK